MSFKVDLQNSLTSKIQAQQAVTFFSTELVGSIMTKMEVSYKSCFATNGAFRLLINLLHL